MLIHALMNFDYDKIIHTTLPKGKNLIMSPFPVFFKEFGKIAKLVNCIQSSGFADILNSETRNRRSGLTFLSLASCSWRVGSRCPEVPCTLG